MADATGSGWTPERIALTFVLVLSLVLAAGSYVAPALGGLSLMLVVSLLSGWVGFKVTRGVIRAGLLGVVDALEWLGGIGFAVIFFAAVIPGTVIAILFLALYEALGIPGLDGEAASVFWVLPIGAWFTGALAAYTVTKEPSGSEREEGGVPSVDELFATKGPAPSDLPLPTGYWTARTDRLAALRREFEAGHLTQAEYEARRDEVLAD